MKELRIGIIGCGGMAHHHMGYLPKIQGVKFTAAADIAPAVLQRVAEKHPDVKTFDDGYKLIDSGLADIVLIATPHYFHPPYAIAAFRRGLHVLSEKPVAVTAKAAQEMIDEHRKHKDLVFGVMFQMRVNPMWRKVKRMIDDGALGEIRRVHWICTNWFRTQAYYDSGGWRATWAGEGGGVLINQCPHNLDLITWFLGLPSRVIATVGIGKHHHIEVEDEVNALLEYPNGAMGGFVTTTGEAPGTNRLEIAGNNATLVAGEGGKIEIWQNDVPADQFLRESRQSFATPPTFELTLTGGGQNSGHEGITRNFLDHIRDRKVPLIAPGPEGIKGLELGNAMLLSGLTGKPVPIPTPREDFDKLIRKMAKTSKFQKKVAKPVSADLGASFK